MEYIIGVMSGTAMDAIDAALVAFDNDGCPTMVENHRIEIPASLLADLRLLQQPGEREIDRLGRVDRQLAYSFADAVTGLLNKTDLGTSEVRAIGCHGQTIRHTPGGPHGFTLQLGCPATLASHTGIPVITDFRRGDIAVGGQGGPLLPAFHLANFSGNEARFICNLSGIANLTLLPAPGGEAQGFDTGPGNCLMDAWSRERFGQPFDKDGAIAASGQIHGPLLESLLTHPYFLQPAPKSTARDLFNTSWLMGHLNNEPQVSDEDVMATLLALTVHSIVDAIMPMVGSGTLYVCGGGAYNPALMRQLSEQLPGFTLGTTDKLGLPPSWVSTVAMAWLAWCHLNGRPSNLPAITGAEREAVLGGYYPAN